MVDVLKPGDQPPRAALCALALAANLASVGPAKARLLKAGILKPTATGQLTFGQLPDLDKTPGFLVGFVGGMFWGGVVLTCFKTWFVF